MGAVEDHRATEALHDLKGAHVHHQIVVAKAGAALGEENAPANIYYNKVDTKKDVSATITNKTGNG